MQRTLNLLFFVLLFLFFSLSGNVQVGAGGTGLHIRGEGMKIENLHAKGKVPTKISRIQLAVGAFDPLLESEPFPVPQGMNIQAYPSGETGYYILQFKGPVKQEWKDAIIEAGATILDYVPNFAFIVKMGEETKLRVEGMVSVRWIGIYQPAYRVEPQLMQSYVLGEQIEAATLIVVTFPEENVNLIVDVLKTMGGTVLEVSETEWKGKIRVQIDSTRIAEIAKIQGVKWIEKAPVWKLFNDVSRGIMNVDPVWSPNNLFGEGQVVAVADTGLDQGLTNPANLHDDFEDGNPIPNSRVIQIFNLVGPPDTPDDVNSGHGTHVAGSVLGNGEESGSDPPSHDYTGSYAGVAPEAQLIFQAIENNATGFLTGIPSDLNTLFNQARTAGAHIHTNSWGSSEAGTYTSFSEDVDQNTWTNKDFTILFSAGNEGVDSNGDGIIDLYSMGSPATAKNCITVGASENNRPTGSSPTPGYDIPWATGSWAFYYPENPIAIDHVSNNSEGMAAFSSRGPCLDGRTKPDVVAPGTNIISTLSSKVSAPDLWGSGGLAGGLENYYIFSGGTSMSTPLVAGAAALVREFYTDQGVTPSSALIKATLLNGAFDISPGQYGTGGSQEIPDPPRPNNIEGWGRLDLESSLFIDSREYFDETPGLTTGATYIFNFEVGDGTVPLKVMLVWTDYPGSTLAGGGLVNDLDLIVVDPASTWHYPNNASQRGQTTIISYDDEGYENFWRLTSPGGGFAVKFTPTSYPAILDKARFILITSTTAQFRCTVWDDDGPGEMPGTSLFSSDVTPPYFPLPYFGWFTVDILGVTIPDGSFYIELRYTSSGVNNPYLGLDQSVPNNTSYVYDGSSWSLLPYSSISNGDWAIQAVVTAEDTLTSSDRVNNAVGIDIDNPATGSYSVRVEGYNIPMGPQPYALVVKGGTITSLPPQAPSGLSANAVSSSRIDLSWTDNSIGETGFKIEGKTGAAGVWEQLAIVGANETSYADTSCAASTTYYYQVFSYNSIDDSGPSNEASDTTPAAPPAFPPIGGGDGDGGLCFIATAAYGSHMAKDVEILEKVRDEYLLTNELGRVFVSFYYSYSPPVARMIVKNPLIRKIVRIGLYPAVGLSKWLVEADDSKQPLKKAE